MDQSLNTSLQTQKGLALQLANLSHVYSKLLHCQTQGHASAKSNAIVPTHAATLGASEQACPQQQEHVNNVAQLESAAKPHPPHTCKDGQTSGSQAMLTYHQELVDGIIAGQNSILFLPTGAAQASSPA